MTKGINGHEEDLGGIIHAQGDFEDMWAATWYTRLLSAPQALDLTMEEKASWVGLAPMRA